MVVKLLEGFEVQPLGLWTVVAGTPTFVGGRLGGNAVHIFDATIRRPIPGSLQTLTFGIAVQPKAWGANRDFVGLYQQSDNAWFGGLRANGSGNYQVVHCVGGTPTAVGTTAPFRLNTWEWFEFTYVYAASGSIIVKCNGNLVYSYSGDTRYPGGAGTGMIMDRFDIGCSEDLWLDDLYVVDTATGLGNCQVVTMLPGADVATGWTPSTGTSHFAVVDDAVMSDYVSAAAGSGAVDTWTLAVPGTVTANAYGVEVRAQAANDIAGTGAVALLADGQQSASAGLSTGTSQLSACWDTASAGTPWTPSKLASAAFGVKAV
jgi:hypothetical protein